MTTATIPASIPSWPSVTAVLIHQPWRPRAAPGVALPAYPKKPSRDGTAQHRGLLDAGATRLRIGETNEGGAPSGSVRSKRRASPDPQPPRTLPRLAIGIHPVESLERPASDPAASIGAGQPPGGQQRVDAGCGVKRRGRVVRRRRRPGSNRCPLRLVILHAPRMAPCRVPRR